VKNALLVAREITVDRDARRIVAAATIALESASVITVAGPSGCGKSTLLRAIATLIPRTTGQILLEGRDLQDVGLCEYRRRVAYVPQLPRMFEGTVAENIRTGPRFSGIELSDARVIGLIERVGLGAELLSRAATELSGGERLRVALARSLANEPRVLLLDEPTSALDPVAAGVILDLLVTLAQGGTALMVVTHSVEHANHLGGEHHRMAAGVLSGAAP
jgi:putative ABC transport system ATP-binding protein